jgi:N utilization substance protein B
MYTRREYRKVVMQSLYEIDMTYEMNINILDAKNVLNRNINEFLPGSIENEFAINLFTVVMERLITIDEIITKAAPEWPVEKISIVDRNVLRIGLSEMVFGDKNNVPPKVAIDEAIEVAKEFGGESSSKFVNGVLGAVYKELKGDDKSDEDQPKKNFKVNTKREEVRVGVIIFTKLEEAGKIEYYVLLDSDRFGSHTFVKGEDVNGSDREKFIKNYVLENIGLDIRDIEYLDHNAYISHHPEKGNVHKIVYYHTAICDFRPAQNLKLESKSNYVWVKISEIDKTKVYKDLKPMLMRVIDEVLKK